MTLPSRAEAEEASSAASEPTTPHTGDVYIDPLGFLVFGPTVGAEFDVGPASLLAYGRWFSVGALSNSMFTDGKETFAFSYGAGLGGRYWLSGDLQGLHLGVLGEYLHTQIDDESILISYKSSFVVPQIEGGYRVGLGRFLVGVRGAVGYAFRTSSTIEDMPGGSSANLYEAEDVNEFYAAASLDLGVYF